MDNKEQPGQSLGGSSDGVEASLSDGNASLLNRASLLTPLNLPRRPLPPTLPTISKHKPHRQWLTI